MKTIIFSIMTAALTFLTSAGYDVKNPALNPVKFAAAPSHPALNMVSSGKVNFAIVCDLNAERHSREKSIGRAAEVIADNVEKCTGTRPAICDAANPDSYRKYSLLLLLGDSPLSRKHGISADKLPPEGFVVRTFPGGVAIVGDDSTTRVEKRHPLDYGSARRGTLWGAFDFLERFFGCRYYFPGIYGTLTPRVANLTIAPVAYGDAPHFRNRSEEWFIWTMNGWSANSEERYRKTWAPYLGAAKDMAFTESWRLARTTPFWAGHNPSPQKLAQKYPDMKELFFYRAPNGNFYYNANQHIGNYFDVTDLKFADFLVDSLKRYYAGNGRDNDGWGALSYRYIPFGQCDSEVPLPDMQDNPTVKKERLITPENIARGDSYSDIYGRFYQYFGRRIKKEFPEKKIILLPYSNYTQAPLNPKWQLPDNIELRVCVFDFPARTRNPEVVKKWQDKMNDWYKALGNRPVTSLWLYNVPKNPFARAIAPRFIADIPKIFGRTLGNTDMFFDQYFDMDFSFYYADYAGVRGMWSPDFNAGAAIDEHWEPFYGKAAGKYLREFYQTLYDNYMKYFVPGKNGNNPLYPPPEIDKLEKLLRAAEKSIPPDSVEMKRFRLFAAPWQAAISSQRNRQAYERPVYGVYQLLPGEKIEVDGKADEAVWSKVGLMPTMEPSGSGAARKFPAAIHLCWAPEGLYGLVVSPYAPGANGRKSLWENSNLEIFVSPGNRREDYYHYAIDVLNRTHIGTKQFVPVEKPYNSYYRSPGFKSAVGGGRNEWTAEFFIPYKDLNFAKPHVYGNWYFNIVTNKASEPKEFSSSSMTLGNNHNLPQYGIIKFLGKGE